MLNQSSGKNDFGRAVGHALQGVASIWGEKTSKIDGREMMNNLASMALISVLAVTLPAGVRQAANVSRDALSAAPAANTMTAANAMTGPSRNSINVFRPGGKTLG